ncbi:hypothetical protein Tcan_02763 [Toxocara canis]|uniref:Uncharacterized protein n=1 Tax=Toxocara canis TaxID=6265 RepID=A0A0B2VWM1_TOXCA|nr:hypothetical protein Tcan_02763 [Toxocara canis]
MIIFLIQYVTSIKHNVLLADQIESGFSTLNQTRLGFSFYMEVAAMCVLLIPSTLMFLTADKSRRRRVEKQIPVDNTVFMY